MTQRFITMKLISFLTVFWIAFPGSEIVQAQKTEHTRNAELYPVRITYDELIIYINQVRSLIGLKTLQDYESQRITLESKESEFTLDGEISTNKIKSVHFEVEEIYFDIDLNESRDIYSVQLRISDSYQEISVSGSSREKVVSVVAFTEDFFSKNSTYFGGEDFRLFGGISLLLSVGVFFAVGLQLAQSNIQNISVFVIYAIGFGSIFLVPWAEMFPVLVILHDQANYFERNSHIFTFFSFVLAIAIPIASISYKLFSVRD